MFETEFEQLLNKYRDAVAVRSRFSGLIKDYFLGQQKQIHLLLTAYDLGIAQEIEAIGLISQAFAFRFVKRLTEDYGISRVNADWAVSMWCVCYGQRVLKKPCEIKLNTGQKSAAPSIVEEKSGSVRYGDLFRYETHSSGKGLTVTGFQGENRRAIIFQNMHRNVPVVEIKEKAFSESDLEEAILTDGIVRIGHHAFSGCLKLHQVIVPPNLKEIGEYAFAGCPQLKTIAFPAELEQIGSYAFSGTGLKVVSIPKTLYWLGEGAFSQCHNIESIEIPQNVDVIPARVFQNCVALKQVSLHEQVIAIGEEAFSGCENLMELYVPDTVQSIGTDAFQGVHKKFILLCGMGSYAESYARANKLNYQLV